MLSKPETGWPVFSLGDFRADVSYLTDIPFDWLISCKNALKYNIPASFFLEEEGEQCILTSYGRHTHIIICDDDEDEYTLKNIYDVDLIDLSHMLITDIKMYFEDWVKWYSSERTGADFARRRTELSELITETEGYMSAAAGRYNKKALTVNSTHLRSACVCVPR